MQKLNVDAFRTARSPVITHPMRDYPAAWPKADSAKCCIFEAVNIVGKAKYGDKWDGTELSAMTWAERPVDAEARRLGELGKPVQVSKAPPPISIARDLPISKASAQNSKQVGKNYNSHVFAKLRHEHENRVASEQALWDANRAALARLMDASEWLAQQCRDSALTAYVRLRSGGPLTEMGPWEWNVDTPLLSFVASGGFDRWFPNVPQALPVFIFFERDALLRATAAFEHVPSIVSQTDLARLSPYLQFAVKLSLAKQYAVGDPTKEARKADFEQQWEAALRPQAEEEGRVMKRDCIFLARSCSFHSTSLAQQALVLV